jgi:hypothetical protein
VTVAPPGPGSRAGAADRAHLARVHEAEALVDDIAATRQRLRGDARRTLGVTGVAGEKAPPLRRVLKENQVSVYPLTALGALSVVDTFQTYAFTVLTPEISRSPGHRARRHRAARHAQDAGARGEPAADRRARAARTRGGRW